MSNAPASIGPAVNLDTIADVLLSGDGTYSITGRPFTGAGIVVATAATPEDAAIIVRPRQRRPAIVAWVREAVADVMAHPAPFYRPRYLGSWIDPATGMLYLDVVEIFAPEERDAAIAAGKARDQIAVWDNGAQELIETNGTGAID